MTAKGKRFETLIKENKCIKERIFGKNKRQNLHSRQANTQTKQVWVCVSTAKLSVNLNKNYWRDTRLITK